MALARSAIVLCAFLVLTAAARSAGAEPGGAGGWAAAFPAVAADVQARRPFVTVVVVPLCHNGQIDCGSGPAGRPGDLATNLYWGAIFGAKRFFERRSSGWERVDVAADRPGLLERAVYRRRADPTAWGVAGFVEQIVVLEAAHGDAIDAAVRRFWTLATEGGRISFRDGERVRDERVHVAGYAGHNRLMDGLALPEPRAGARPIPSFVLACYSQSYFESALLAAGSTPLITTRALMAPEGYVVDAAVRGLGDGGTGGAVRQGVVAAYARWQRLPFGVAASMFVRATASP